MYYLLNDSEGKKIIYANSRRAAIKYMRDFLCMKGRVRIVENCGYVTTYHMDKSDYSFSLTLVLEEK